MTATSSSDNVELPNHACSRIAGELAMAAGIADTPEDYLEKTKAISVMQTEGSVAEFLFFVERTHR